MRLLPDTRKQSQQAGRCAAAGNSPPYPLRVLLSLGGTILLLAADAANSRPAAFVSDMSPLQTISAPSSPTAPQPSHATIPVENNTLRPDQNERLMPRSSPIHITRQQTEPLDPLLRDAYLAYRNGRLDEAQQLYLAMFKKDARNTDVLLGLAAIALQQEENQIAAQYYSRVLILDPRNAWANAGMSALNPDDDGNESRLKILLREQGNSAALHFALGNLYAEQSRWGEAQQAYFNAYTLESGNAGFAFNLAVSLDHLGQKNLAARHYQSALQLDQSNIAGFDHAQISQHIEELIH